MYIKEEEFSDRHVIEWLVSQIKLYHLEKYGEECEISQKENGNSNQ
jgi:hypothetical protein